MSTAPSGGEQLPGKSGLGGSPLGRVVARRPGEEGTAHQEAAGGETHARAEPNTENPQQMSPAAPRPERPPTQRLEQRQTGMDNLFIHCETRRQNLRQLLRSTVATFTKTDIVGSACTNMAKVLVMHFPNLLGSVHW